MSDGAPKSAYELAMERLRKQDEAEGVTRREPTDADKAAIADLRSFYQAKIAEIELRHQSAMGTVFDPTERQRLEAEYRRDRERLADERDRKIERVRRGEDR